MLFVLGMIIVIGVCNDIATIPQIIFGMFIGFSMMMLYVLFSRHQRYYLTLVSPNGEYKKIRAYNLFGKFMAVRRYKKLGYKVESEYEVIE